MFINKELVEYIEQQGLDVNEALFFCFAVEYDNPYNLMDVIHNSDLINAANEPIYRINLCEHDIENGKYKLKLPLFKSSNNDNVNNEFLNFITTLSKNNMTVRGHRNNQRDYAVITNDEATKLIFNQLISTIRNQYNGNIDIDKLVRKTVNYYETVDMPVKLDKFLSTFAYTYYISEDSQAKDKMI